MHVFLKVHELRNLGRVTCGKQMGAPSLVERDGSSCRRRFRRAAISRRRRWCGRGRGQVWPLGTQAVRGQMGPCMGENWHESEARAGAGSVQSKLVRMGVEMERGATCGVNMLHGGQMRCCPLCVATVWHRWPAPRSTQVRAWPSVGQNSSQMGAASSAHAYTLLIPHLAHTIPTHLTRSHRRATRQAWAPNCSA